MIGAALFNKAISKRKLKFKRYRLPPNLLFFQIIQLASLRSQKIAHNGTREGGEENEDKISGVRILGHVVTDNGVEFIYSETRSGS